MTLLVKCRMKCLMKCPMKCPMKYSIKTLMKPCLGGFLVCLLVMSPLGTGLILADVLADDCAECTQTERDQLRIRRAHQTALSLNDLLGELERLAHYPEAARLLLADHDEQLRNQLEGVLAAIQSVQSGASLQASSVQGASLPDALLPEQGAEELSAEAVAQDSRTQSPSAGSATLSPDFSDLRPVYAHLADARRDLQAEAILMSPGGEPLFLAPGSKFQHQAREYTMRAVRPGRGEDGGFEIYLERSEGGWEILVWQ